MAAAATMLPFQSNSAAAVSRTLSRAFSSRHSLLLHASRHGRHLLRQSLASSPVAHRDLRRARSLSTSVASEGSNGAVPADDKGREYDYDLFTISAGSRGMRASRTASSLYGARAAVCEMPFATVASDALGGVGGTYVLRRCIPKKLLVWASKYSHQFEESRSFGWMCEIDPKLDWRTLITNKNLELQRLVGVQTNTLKNSGVTIIEGRGKIAP